MSANGEVWWHEESAERALNALADAGHVILGLESNRYRGGLRMRSVTYSMGVSLDGYVVGPDGAFDWTAPDEDVFRFAIEEIREVGVHVLGRRLYETMLYWEAADQDPSLDDAMLEWAGIWKPLPKVVDLELVETRTFSSRVVYLRYRVAR